ncbi:MAG: TetR/AcrR family transcriptional regulator [Lachnospiraceae bacterium]|nr:TetR/AcrR family transcriptional regulator [Lachnospiraceae bacterium]
MNGKFFDLKKEKQDRMINAALKVFAMHGYRHASTDDIVREASISKGLLFHYFGSKLGVYSFIYDYSVRYMTLELNTSVDKKCTDMFTLMKQIENARMHAMRGYPYMQQFLNRSMAEDVSEALLAIEEKRNILNDAYDRINSQMDFSELPAEVDGEKLRKMLDFTIKGLMTERFQDASFQPEMLYEEIVDYLDMIRKIVCR